jgi:hypothetical protein
VTWQHSFHADASPAQQLDEIRAEPDSDDRAVPGTRTGRYRLRQRHDRRRRGRLHRRSGASATSGTTYESAEAVRAARWSGNVTITVGDDSFTFVSNGIPDHELADQYLIPRGAPNPSVAVPETTATDAAIAVAETPVRLTIGTPQGGHRLLSLTTMRIMGE